MNKVLVAAAVGIAALIPRAHAEQASETLNITVAEVDVVVLDAAGHTVRGLTRDDFELTVGGKRREITNFYAADRAEANEGGKASATAPAPTATPSQDVIRPNRVIFFVDDAHIHFVARRRVLNQLQKFIRDHVRGDTAAMLVAFDNDLRVVQPFTTDPSVLAHAVDVLGQRASQGQAQYERERRELIRKSNDTFASDRDAQRIYKEYLQFAEHERTRTEGAIAALESTVKIAGAVEGRRMLVYVSEGLPLHPGEEVVHSFHVEKFGSDSSVEAQLIRQSQPFDELSTDATADFTAVAKKCAAAGVQFFALDPGGLRVDTSDVLDSTPSEINATLARENLRAPMQLLADETGGRLIENENDLDAAFGTLLDQLTTYYSLGFRSDADGKDADVRVRVRRPGLAVRATRSIHQRTARQDLEARLRANLYFAREENPLDAHVAIAGVQTGLHALVRVPMSRLSMTAGDEANAGVAIFVAMLDTDMNESPIRLVHHKYVSSDVAEAVQRIAITTKPGKYVVSIAVADQFTGEASYFVRNVTVE